MVKALEQRVSELEKKLEPLEEREAGDQLKQRLARIEATIKEEALPNELRASWKDGLCFESRDKRFALKVGGRIQCDWAFFDQDGDLKLAVGDEDDGVEFRRARINLEGRIYDTVGYRAEYDFAGNNGQGKFKDVYIALTQLPVIGNLKLGHCREPFGLERCTGVSYHTFMELPLPTVFAPNRNLGLMLHNAVLDERLTWAVGAFKDVDDFPSDDDSDEDQGYAVTARLTGLPWYRDEGRKLLHLGLAYSHRNPDGAVPGWQTRPESHLANQYLNTEAFEGFRLVDARMDDVDLWGTEAALIHGPFSLQGEYMRADVDSDFAGDLSFDGYYVQGAYFLTGEHRPYKRSSAAFGRVRPRRNFSLRGERGWGAWEAALRYSHLDLNDGVIRGGEEENYALGLNWYLNPNTRVMLNYVRAAIDHDLYDGDLDILQSRFQIDF